MLNEETGLTLKANPSAIDLMNFFGDPVGYFQESFHSGAVAAWNLFNMEPYDYESEEDFRNRKLYYAFELIPFLGSHINRYRTAVSKGASPLLGLLMSPLFNTTWTPAQGGAYETWGARSSGYRRTWQPGYNRYYRGPSYYTYPRRSYPRRMYVPREYHRYNRGLRNIRTGYKDWSGFSTFNRTYYGAYAKFRRNAVYPTKNYRSLNVAFSDIWRRSMTKKGNPKYKFLAFPTNKWTLKLKVNILRNITSYARWQ